LPSSFVAHCAIEYDGGIVVGERGLLCLESVTGYEVPQVNDGVSFVVSENGEYGICNFMLPMTNLDANTQWRVRAYAINDDGVGYSDVVNISTINQLQCDISYIINGLIVWYVLARCMEQDLKYGASIFFMDMFMKNIDYLTSGEIKK